MLPKVLIAPAPMREIPESYAPVLESHFELVYPTRVAQMTVPELLAHLPGCVASLAGYADNESGRTLTFAYVQNATTSSQGTKRQDELGNELVLAAP